MSEQEVIQFNEFLSRRMEISLGVIIIAFIVFLIMFISSLKTGLIKELDLQIAFALFFVLLVVGYLIEVLPYQLDIKQQSYVEYTGEFYVEDYYFGNRDGPFIFIKYPDKEKSIKYKALSNLQGVENETTYNGSIIIAKHSKTVVKFDALPS